MGTSAAKTTGYIAGEDPATVEANRVYQDALARLSQSLDTRKNRFFDPVWLAAAQGFGAPTQTGGFGESLGNAAKSISAAQAEDIKEEQAINEQRVAAAGKGVELQRMRARDADIVRYLKGDQEAEPPAKGPLSAAPVVGPGALAVAGPKATPLPKVGDKYAYTYIDPIDRKYGESETRTVTQADLNQLDKYRFNGIPIDLKKIFEPPTPAVREVPATAAGLSVKPGALPASAPVAQAPQGGLSTGYNMLAGIQIMPANPAFMSQKEYVALNRNDPSKSLAELLAKGAELEKQRYEKTEAGIVDYKTGMFNPLASGKFESTPIFGPGFDGKSYLIPQNIAMMLTNLAAQGNFEGYAALANRFVGKSFGQPAGSAPAAAGSVDERERANEKAKQLEAANTAMEIENRKDFATRSKDASEMLATANVMRSFTADPNFSKMTGILSNDKISSGIALLVRDGIGGKNFTIGIPAIEDVMRNAGLTKEQQATFRTFLMYSAQMQLNAEKAMKGATSERERLILGNANISPQDTAEAVRRKADLLTTKAQFDRQAARAFKASKMTADEFLDSPQYMGMYDKYFEDISGIATGLKSYQKPAVAAPAGAPAAGAPPVSDPIKAAQERVRRELNKK